MPAKTTWKEIRDRRITTEQDERDVRRYYDLHELALRLAEVRKQLGITQARLADDPRYVRAPRINRVLLLTGRHGRCNVLDTAADRPRGHRHDRHRPPDHRH